MGLFDPDRYFSRLTAIDIDKDLLGRGFHCVLLDIDNTIRERDTSNVPYDIRSWIEAARSKGVRICLLSNNWHSEVQDLAVALDLQIVPKACKPLPFGYLRAMDSMSASKGETVAIGDQLWTDTLGAHLSGIASYLVLPLVEADALQAKPFRALERAFLGKRDPEPGAVVVCQD